MSKQEDEELLERTLDEQREIICLIKEILEEIKDERKLLKDILRILKAHNLTGFTPIQEINMVPLAAGQTATFATTPIPGTSVPDPTKLIYSSSDPVAFPLTPNPADPTGLSTNLTFPDGTAAGVSFSLTLNYTNVDGTVATQTNSYVTGGSGSPDVTGFAPIVQVA